MIANVAKAQLDAQSPLDAATSKWSEQLALLMKRAGKPRMPYHGQPFPLISTGGVTAAYPTNSELQNILESPKSSHGTGSNQEAAMGSPSNATSPSVVFDAGNIRNRQVLSGQRASSFSPHSRSS